jgi:hypothetical protein
MENLPLGRDAIGQKYFSKVKANPMDTSIASKRDWLPKDSISERELTSPTLFFSRQAPHSAQSPRHRSKRNKQIHSTNNETTFLNADLHE